jgi:type II secretory ATPase GspE/PulE/Tfp pilus assembly ATPase PilB-like protein
VIDHDDFLAAAIVEEGVLPAEAVASARRAAAERRVGVGQVLVERRQLTPEQVAMLRAGVCEVAYVDPGVYRIELRNGGLVPRSMAEGLCAFPLFVVDGLATVGMSNPLDLRAVDQLRAALKCDVEPVLCEEGRLRALIERAYAMLGGGGEEASASGAEELTTGREPLVAAVNQILADAVEAGASDVHLSPDEKQLHLRFRVDGALLRRQGPSLSAHAGIVQRIKVMAHLDLTQTRRPQDGKFRFVHAGRGVDVRVSIIPTVCGENVVMRLLSNAGEIRDFAELGMSPEQVGWMEGVLASPNGILLVTGPTGSGKTTTLYAALRRVNTPDRNVVTIEDPVEIRMPLVRQVQTNSEIGLTFASALRSILRQDPDVILVGEIRDEETARIAVQAALTGHLVLSSLHTNDAVGAVPRLLDFSIPPFAIAGSLLGVVAQRLVRRVCGSCARTGPVAAYLAARFGVGAGERLVSGAGCVRCGNTGYKGRVGLYELLRVTPSVQAVLERRDTALLRRAAVASGMVTLAQDGLAKARLGLTTLEEVLRVASVAELHEGSGGPGAVAAEGEPVGEGEARMRVPA